MANINVNQTNASETAKGIVEEATQAQLNAGTDTGETGARLFAVPSKILSLLGSYLTTASASATYQTIAGLFNSVMALVLTGFSAGSNTSVAATDTLAQALAKIQGQINARPNETATTIAAITNATASKNPPIDADEVVGMDSANSFVLIKYSWTNIKAFLKTYFDSLYQATLVSGTNIKTINGNSLLAAGDLAIGSDWVLVDSASASNHAAIDFPDLTSTYHAYCLIITDLIPQTDNTILSFRTSTDNGSTFDSGATDYKSALSGLNDSATGFVSGSTGTTQMNLIGAVGSGANETLSATIWVYKPSSATFCKVDCYGVYYSSVPDLRQVRTVGARAAAADVDAIRVYMSSGNITSGEFRLYGIKNA